MDSLDYNEQTNDQIYLKELAQKLAINHFNVSISKSNSQYEASRGNEFAKEKIFVDQISEEELYFSRNIVIIGAGASRNSYEFIGTVVHVITELHEKLNLEELLGVALINNTSLLFKKYIEVASKIKKSIFNENPQSKKEEFEKIKFQLGFEENLELLLHFFKQEDINSNLIEILNFKYLPTLPYEIIAHLFKHRYIDVIINLNFDELLDNAIEDEMGETKYFKYINGQPCENFKNIVDNNRLRIPVYIKLHGSISTSSTLKYTHSSYIEIPHDIKQFLTCIFSGDTGINRISNFNVIFIGYRFHDIDIQDLLFNHLNLLSNTNNLINYFVFSLDPKGFIDDFSENFKIWYKNNFEINLTLQDIRLNCISNARKIRVASNYQITEIKDTEGLGNKLLQLYGHIQSAFHTPFKPKPLTRHLLLVQLFPRNGITNNEKKEYSIEYFYNRSIFYLLFDFIKYKGRIPLNLITSDRSAKYYELYKSEVKRKFQYEEERFVKENLFDILCRVEINQKFEINNHYVVLKDFYEASESENSGELTISKIINEIAKELTGYSYNEEKNNREFIINVATKLRNEVFNTRTNEINAVYDDPKHRRFHPFSKHDIIFTNLELTWRFFEQSIMKIKSWDTMCIIDDSGKALFNLYSEATPPICYLTELKNAGKNILLVHSIEKPRFYDKRINNYDENIILTLKEKLNVGGSPELFISKFKDDKFHNMHRMALFIKDDKPVYGIYFFRPSAKVRINPVQFDISKSENNANSAKNLNILKDLFYYELNG